ncbi:hypothetical protein EVA_04363 [gut metagenome]|uniref:Uncharacterized protein n=1 Tax=gut metagenome TaxID=749906 RepID=J9GIV5_9ZZZZ
MRKELYRLLCSELKTIDLIKHIDLWNHNVEFIEQEENWQRPAVFVEFCPIQWNAIAPGVEYRAEPLIKLHIVTDWEGSSAEGSKLQEDALKVFDLPGLIHARLAGLNGKTFLELDLVESDTNHNHEDIVESIEVYQCVAIKRLQ